jgi:hypothetical protein
MGDMLGLGVKKDKAAERRIEEQRRKEERRLAEEKDDEARRKSRAGTSDLVKTTEMGAVAEQTGRKTKLSGIV